jgi:adenylylsulfate kinase
MVSAVVLTGAPGSGKSSVLDALATRLEIEGVPHAAIESEQLARGFPLLPGDRWIDQLAAVLKLQREAGRRLFVIAATTETADELRGVLAAAGARRSLVICLVASAALVTERLQQREPDAWPGKQQLIAHARELADSIPRQAGVDLRIETDRSRAPDIAAELVREMRLHRLVDDE